MKIFNHINEIEREPNTILTIGTFDGLHLGHQEILKKLFERSRIHGGRNLLVTFHPHPRKVIMKSSDQKILSTPEEKADILEKLGLGNLLFINFTKAFSQQSPVEFIRDFVIEKIGLKEIIVGYDHKFGKAREGNHETLRKLGSELNFGTTFVDAFKIGDEIINSTKIRHALLSGSINHANNLLGRPYSFSGIVVEGDKRGRLLGYPTANIRIADNDKLLPALGIYAAEVFIDNQKYEALLSVGQRPTFYEEGEVVPEVYIYNFDKNIYHKDISVNILEMIRSEEKFSSADELVIQMNQDKEAGLRIFNQLSRAKNLSTSRY
jgi:riboflavin kinase / FMN adenylyltransferase